MNNSRYVIFVIITLFISFILASVRVRTAPSDPRNAGYADCAFQGDIVVKAIHVIDRLNNPTTSISYHDGSVLEVILAEPPCVDVDVKIDIQTNVRDETLSLINAQYTRILEPGSHRFIFPMPSLLKQLNIQRSMTIILSIHIDDGRQGKITSCDGPIHVSAQCTREPGIHSGCPSQRQRCIQETGECICKTRYISRTDKFGTLQCIECLPGTPPICTDDDDDSEEGTSGGGGDDDSDMTNMLSLPDAIHRCAVASHGTVWDSEPWQCQCHVYKLGYGYQTDEPIPTPPTVEDNQLSNNNPDSANDQSQGDTQGDQSHGDTMEVPTCSTRLITSVIISEDPYPSSHAIPREFGWPLLSSNSHSPFHQDDATILPLVRLPTPIEFISPSRPFYLHITSVSPRVEAVSIYLVASTIPIDDPASYVYGKCILVPLAKTGIHHHDLQRIQNAQTVSSSSSLLSDILNPTVYADNEIPLPYISSLGTTTAIPLRLGSFASLISYLPLPRTHLPETIQEGQEVTETTPNKLFSIVFVVVPYQVDPTQSSNSETSPSSSSTSTSATAQNGSNNDNDEHNLILSNQAMLSSNSITVVLPDCGDYLCHLNTSCPEYCLRQCPSWCLEQDGMVCHDDYTCTCIDNDRTLGLRMDDMKIPQCVPKQCPCLNEGLCAWYPETEILAGQEKDPYCQCKPGYSGPLCEIEPCIVPKDTCRHGKANCNGSPGSCQCFEGWETSEAQRDRGVFCGTCSKRVKQPPVCVVENTHPISWSTEHCSRDICICKQGWTGKDCSYNLGTRYLMIPPLDSLTYDEAVDVLTERMAPYLAEHGIETSKSREYIITALRIGLGPLSSDPVINKKRFTPPEGKMYVLDLVHNAIAIVDDLPERLK